MTESGSWWTPLTLVGATLTLSPMRLQDAPDYLRALGSPEESAQVVQHLTFRPPADLAEARLIISAALGDLGRMPYVQRVTATGELVGTTSFYEIDPVLRAIAIGHTWIARRFWRTGVNTESKLIMMSRAFEGLGVERLVWHTDIRNTRSQAAIERLGARREGVLRRHRIRPDGSWRDTVQYAMISEEWPEAKARLLAPRVS